MGFAPLSPPYGYSQCGNGVSLTLNPRYSLPMHPRTKQILEHVPSWPEEDQEELAEIARAIEARRTGLYCASSEELAAIDEAEQNGIASEEEVEAAFRTFRRA